MPTLDPIYSLAIAIPIALVFALAGIHKVMDYARHVGVVGNYRVVPLWLLPLLAPTLIVLEFSAVVLVLLSATRRAGLILTIVLLLIYIFAIGLNLLRGRTSIDCGCGWGAQVHQISAWLIFRNSTMVVVAVLALLPSANRSLHLLDWILATFAGTAVMAVYYIGDLLIANWSKLKTLA